MLRIATWSRQAGVDKPGCKLWSLLHIFRLEIGFMKFAQPSADEREMTCNLDIQECWQSPVIAVMMLQELYGAPMSRSHENCVPS